jgi:transposase
MKAIIGVGIDCNKNQHTVCISDNSGKQHGNLFEIKNKVEDMEYLIEKILEVYRTLGKSDVVINMESTGVYHFPLYSALSRKSSEEICVLCSQTLILYSRIPMLPFHGLY